MKTANFRYRQNIVVIRRFEWDAMHRIPGHEGKCAAFHGHRYALEIAVAGARLDHLGRVIDFSVLKAQLGQWIESHFDHNAILFRDDPAVASLIPYNLEAGKPIYLLDRMPTVENIASELAEVATKLLKPFDIDVVSIRVWETPNCSAVWVSPTALPKFHFPDADGTQAQEP
jgi:6-pyruvoyltetrahydropterin/6-carboxytetrahydropterin synthase